MKTVCKRCHGIIEKHKLTKHLEACKPLEEDSVIYRENKFKKVKKA